MSETAIDVIGDLIRERNELRMLASFYRSVALCGDGNKLKSDAEELAKIRELRMEVKP